MPADHLKEERTIVVKPENLFLNDKVFYKVRRTLLEKGIAPAKFIEDQKPSEEMDSVFFLTDRFEILVDARGYKPEELRCVITANNVNVMAQKKECVNDTEKNVSMSRNYQLPQDIVPENGNCCLSSDGILLITAPWRL
ncbi:protein lethal(2)essential for life-like [Coccinella septempunctata]|uniref:protein lethal(2)essential for life-like n=1 Tax=Coccinella septempunctata TaxID=41139 RepID=UPI001D072129|nr:protein lethal(2)essential for life-like [Coccinella septempunctata]